MRMTNMCVSVFRRFRDRLHVLMHYRNEPTRLMLIFSEFSGLATCWDVCSQAFAQIVSFRTITAGIMRSLSPLSRGAWANLASLSLTVVGFAGPFLVPGATPVADQVQAEERRTLLGGQVPWVARQLMAWVARQPKRAAMWVPGA